MQSTLSLCTLISLPWNVGGDAGLEREAVNELADRQPISDCSVAEGSFGRFVHKETEPVAARLGIEEPFASLLGECSYPANVPPPTA